MEDRDTILGEVRRIAEDEGGRAPGRRHFRELTGIKDWVWGRYWRNWSDVLAEAGYSANTMNAEIGQEQLVRYLLEQTRLLGRFPTLADLRMRSHEVERFPVSSTFQKLGDRSTRIALVRDHCETYGDAEDVLQILAAQVPARGQQSSSEKRTRELESDGFVYLLKYKNNFKIGRTGNLDRRSGELSIQLPGKPQRVHVIRTDDPVGIERYWHLRFTERRLNGEWFSLTRDDVKAFKRRTFM